MSEHQVPQIIATMPMQQASFEKGWGTIQIHRAGCRHNNLGHTEVGSGDDTPENIAYIVRVQDGSQDHPEGKREFDWRPRRMPCAKAAK